MWTRIKMPPSGVVALACINPNTGDRMADKAEYGPDGWKFADGSTPESKGVVPACFRPLRPEEGQKIYPPEWHDRVAP